MKDRLDYLSETLLGCFVLKNVLNFKNLRTAVSSLHRVIGVWAMVFKIILFFTGFWMNMDFFVPSGWKINPPIVTQTVSANMDSIIDIAKKSFSDRLEWQIYQLISEISAAFF